MNLDRNLQAELKVVRKMAFTFLEEYKEDFASARRWSETRATISVGPDGEIFVPLSFGHTKFDNRIPLNFPKAKRLARRLLAVYPSGGRFEIREDGWKKIGL